MPPIDQDDNEEPQDLPSSEQANLDEATTAPEGAEGADAASSPAADEKADTLSIVRDVVEDREAAPAEGSSPEGEEETDTPDESASSGPDNENYSDVPFHKHPRFQQLLRDKKAAETGAAEYQKITTFLDETGLAADEAADGLQIMALAKVDPSAAWKRIKPWVEKVLIAAGEVLPKDLDERVQNGELTRDAAIEVSRARAAQHAVTTRQSFDQQQAERREQVAKTNAVMSTAENWKNERLARDPNFAKKQPAFHKELVFITATEGQGDTPEKITDQLNRAYKAVNAALRASAPANPQVPQRKPAVRPVTGGQVAGTARPEPKSTLDIIRANRRTA